MSTTTDFSVPNDQRFNSVIAKKGSFANDFPQITVPCRAIALADAVYTLSAQDILGGYFYASASSTVNRNLTTPTATQIVQAIQGAKLGDQFAFVINNTHSGLGGTGTKTLVGGTGVTIQATSAIIQQNDIKRFVGVVENITSGSYTVTIFPINDSVNGGGYFGFADSTAAAPSLYFASDPDTGIYHLSADGNIIRFAAGGAQIGSWNASALTLQSGGHLVSHQLAASKPVAVAGGDNASATLTGTDVAGVIACVTTAGGAVATIAVTFNTAFATTAPIVTLTAVGAVPPTLLRISAVATTGFTISMTTPAGAGTAYSVNYQVTGILTA